MARDILVIGAGIFGATAALELRRRGHGVTLLDPGPIPHALAASTDISKVIRMEYGPDERYMALAEEAREEWVRWNERWRSEMADPLYHECGVLMICQQRMGAGGFEYESLERLRRRGHTPERLDADGIRGRFPAWSTGRFVDGFYHSRGGYAESGRVVQAVVGWARHAGVDVMGARAAGLLEARGRIVGAVTDEGVRVEATHTVVATGAWTSKLIAGLERCIRATGHPVFHLLPADPRPFQADRFPVFTADIVRTGFYGFPVNRDGVVKVAMHRAGVEIDADAERSVTREDRADLQAFLSETFPDLANAPVVFTRLCLYADTQDGDFWIARDPEREGLTVASGGSGHGFKFAPVLGPIIADAVENRPNRELDRFRWRPDVRLERPLEAARCHVTRA